MASGRRTKPAKGTKAAGIAKVPIRDARCEMGWKGRHSHARNWNRINKAPWHSHRMPSKLGKSAASHCPRVRLPRIAAIRGISGHSMDGGADTMAMKIIRFNYKTLPNRKSRLTWKWGKFQAGILCKIENKRAQREGCTLGCWAMQCIRSI